MTSLMILVPIALLLVCLAIGIYIWAVDNEQFNDLDREATRILFDRPRQAGALKNQNIVPQDALNKPGNE